MVNHDFILICSKAWSWQVLAYMHVQQDVRISPITHHYLASRTAISGAFKHLIELRYVQKNSGHGHPLRPAYVLTKKGRSVAAWAAEFDELLTPNEWEIARRSWALPILRQTNPERRYCDLRKDLHPITDRALSETLKLLGENQWVNRVVDVDQSPPSVTYTPRGIGKTLTPILRDSLRL